MKLGSLPNHPDFDKLLIGVQQLLDNHIADVVKEAGYGKERQVRIAAGKAQGFSLMLGELKEAKRANEE